MQTENPYPAPAPSVLVQMLRIHMWNDRIDDDSRKFHEWAADALEDSLKRNVSLARRLERAEAYIESLTRQEGGAS